MQFKLYKMAKWELLIFVAFAALVCCNEVEDSEQKKRGAGKGTSLNAIPTGAQKQDYTYSIYNQNPSSQQSSSPQYQSQVHSSFYPSQANSQYYSSPSTQSDSSSSYAPQQQQQQQQPPQISLLPPSTTSQFVPLNFVPNPGYQSKYQLVPSKSPGNIQLTFLQQPTYPTQPIVPYAPQLFAPSQSGQVNSHQSQYNPLPQGHFNVAPNYQPLSLGGSFLNHPSTMLLFAQPNPAAYSNLLYQNPVQSFYNYYPTNSQSKYNSVQYVQQGSGQEYEKLQGPVSQGIPKEENDISHSSEYTAPSDTNSSYKNAYTASRSTYAKL